MCHRENVHFACYFAKLVHGTSVGAALVFRKELAHALFDHFVHLCRYIFFAVGVCLGKVSFRLCLSCRYRGSARLFCVNLNGFVDIAVNFFFHPFVYLGYDGGSGEHNLFFARFGADIVYEVNNLVYSFVRKLHSIDKQVFRDFFGSGFNHGNSASVSGYDKVKGTFGHLSFIWVHDKVSVYAADAYRAYWPVPRNIGHRKSKRSSVYCKYIGRVNLVD